MKVSRVEKLGKGNLGGIGEVMRGNCGLCGEVENGEEVGDGKYERRIYKRLKKNF